MRRARAGIGGTGVFYQSCQDLAVELGYPDMFEQPRTKAKCEEYALKRTAEVADYYYEHGEYPVSAGENASEPGEWLAGMRGARRRHKKGVKKSIGRTWYPSCEARAKDLGCPDMFDDPLPRQEFALMRTRQCIEYFNEHGKYPAASKRNRNAVGAWLKQKRTTVKEKGGWTDYRACQKLAEQLGHPNLFGSGSRNIQSSHGPIEQREVRSVA
jgi:hypothetical protein